jgi:hypothetical protein
MAMSFPESAGMRRLGRLVGLSALAFSLGCQAYADAAAYRDDAGAPDVDPSATLPDAGLAEELEPLTHHSLSNEAIMSLVRSYAYRGPDFVLLNAEPFPSTVAPGKEVSLWVSASAQGSMSTVIPERSGSEADIPVGTVIVREVLNGGELETITVMVKLPEGAFPLGGDYWYGATDAEGNIKLDGDGMPVAGLLQNCGTCHLRRSHDAFLFGTPRAYLP